MRKLGTGTVETSSLQLPRQLVAERKETENVRDLQADLQKWGAYLNDPTVRKSDMRVVAGRDRLIAAMEGGRKSVDVQFIECSDDEAEELELVENIHRRSDPEEIATCRRRYLDIVEARYAAQPDGPRKRGGQKTPRGKARDELAKREGVTPKAIADQDRAAEVEEPSPWGADEPEEVPPSIEAFGLDVPPTVDARARRVQAAVDQMDSHLRALAGLVNGLEETGASGHDAQRAKDEYQRLAHALRGLRPQALCPRCKGRVGTEKCLMCMGTGFATKSKMLEDIPPQLLMGGEKAMVQDERGVFRSLSTPAPVKKAKRLAVLVEDADGNAHEVDPDTGLPF